MYLYRAFCNFPRLSLWYLNEVKQTELRWTFKWWEGNLPLRFGCVVWDKLSSAVQDFKSVTCSTLLWWRNSIPVWCIIVLFLCLESLEVRLEIQLVCSKRYSLRSLACTTQYWRTIACHIPGFWQCELSLQALWVAVLYDACPCQNKQEAWLG